MSIPHQHVRPTRCALPHCVRSLRSGQLDAPRTVVSCSSLGAQHEVYTEHEQQGGWRVRYGAADTPRTKRQALRSPRGQCFVPGVGLVLVGETVASVGHPCLFLATGMTRPDSDLHQQIDDPFTVYKPTAPPPTHTSCRAPLLPRRRHDRHMVEHEDARVQRAQEEGALRCMVGLRYKAGLGLRRPIGPYMGRRRVGRRQGHGAQGASGLCRSVALGPHQPGGARNCLRGQNSPHMGRALWQVRACHRD